ncbi:unnamed protein product [Vitrella brassicaformis CCMP3155]|uniref:DNA polymerase lambda n=2 Tax=Vitrella brassicaformis TaxID=1169539 RepID=A0A0G4EBQ4_VITBC|nr:unnamed protein product [Vitrella brassicaformis CCMP3155]|eukprot:CEL92960.1 unnamed protein product [Vitrella brassicaformis CCMP3155]
MAESPSSGGVFSSCSLYFVRRGDLGLSRINTMSQRVKDKGGQVIQDITSTFIDEEGREKKELNPAITHIVVAKTLSRQGFLRFLHDSSLTEESISTGRAKVVRDEWMTKSSQTGKRQNDEAYLYQFTESAPSAPSSASRSAAASGGSDSHTTPPPPLPQQQQQQQPHPVVKQEPEDELAMEPHVGEGFGLGEDGEELMIEGGEDGTVDYTKPSLERNKWMAEHFTELSKGYKASSDQWRHYTYSRAAKFIAGLDKPILSADDIAGQQGIGPRVREKVQELLDTGKLQRLNNFKKDERLQALRSFCQIWGVGPSMAGRLWARGFRTLDDIKKHPEALDTDRQRRCLKYVDDFALKMTRAEVESIYQRVCEKAAELLPGELHLELCGSHRRGETHLGDIDILVTRTDDREVGTEVQRILDSLSGEGFIVDTLSMSEPDKGKAVQGGIPHPEDPGHPSVTFLGVCWPDRSGPKRRIDIKMWHRSEFPFALVHFTGAVGSGHFNRVIRQHAIHMGLHLSEHKLCKAMRDSKRKADHRPGNRRAAQDKIWQGQVIPCESEEEIFAALGIECRPPERRVPDQALMLECSKENALKKMHWFWPDAMVLDRSGSPLVKRQKIEHKAEEHAAIKDETLTQTQHQGEDQNHHHQHQREERLAVPAKVLELLDRQKRMCDSHRGVGVGPRIVKQPPAAEKKAEKKEARVKTEGEGEGEVRVKMEDD